jgi:hypothetical protein
MSIMNMSLDTLPVELANMVFAELPYRSQLRLRATCKYMASIAENYTDYGCQLTIRGSYDRWPHDSLQMKIIPNASFRCLVNQKCRSCPTNIVTLEQLRASESNGLGFWLKRLWRIKFPRLNHYNEVAHMQNVLNILEHKGLQHTIDFEIKDTLWLVGWSFIDMVDRIKQSTLDLSVVARMIARKDFKTRSKDGAPEFSLGKFTDVKLSIPGGRKVSELFAFEDGAELRLFEMNSCGDVRSSLWGIGHMAELFSRCKTVERLHLEKLTVIVDRPLEDDDWSLQNVDKITMHNVTLRSSNRVRRSGRKGKKGSLQKSGSPFMLLDGASASEVRITNATFSKDPESKQLVLNQLSIYYSHFSPLLSSESFRKCSLEHITLVEIPPFWDRLLSLAEFKTLRTITVLVPFHQLESVYSAALNDVFTRLVESNSFLGELNLLGANNQIIRSLVP